MLHAPKGNLREPVLNLLDEALDTRAIKPVELALIAIERKFSSSNMVFDPSSKELLYAQVETLKRLGYPAKILKKVPEPSRGTGLLVIPSTLVSLERQMRLLGIDADDDIADDFDKNESNKEPYWIYRLREETFEPPLTCTSVREIMRGQGLRGLTFAEGLALYAQNPIWVLQDSSLVLFGAAPSNAPEITVFGTNPIQIGPNNYGGEQANHSRYVTCAA